MATTNKLDRNEKYTKIIVGIITVVTIAFGVFGAYISDQTSIAKAQELSKSNLRQIESIKTELRHQTITQTNTMHQILIKITRLETKIETLIKR